jgi:tetratricopeptide (TPR) repeat protein
MSAKRGLTLVLLLAAAVSCRSEPDQQTGTMDAQEAVQQKRESLPVEVVAQLDSGSAAFKAEDHQAALAHYTKATEIAPELAAAWFGVYMAQEALGNTEAARQALEKAQTVEPGATLLRPSGKDTVR